MSVPRLWVVPVNDGEAAEVRDLLRQNGELVLISAQKWGASWAGLEPELQACMQQFRRSHPEGEIIGIELEGTNRCDARDIDHHRYSDSDRSNPLSSLEQVAAILGVALTRRQQLIAENDKGYIPAMRRAGATDEEIADIRVQDRAAQGITPANELQAEQDLASAQWRGRKVLVACPCGATSAHSDRLFGRADETLLVAPDKWAYFGCRHRLLHDHAFPEQHWSGGSPENGFFGILNPSPPSQEAVLRFFWQSGE